MPAQASKIASSELLSLSELSALRLQAEQIQSSVGFLQKLDSRNAGWLPTSALGSGMDYAESRLYQQGDDPRSINWRLSARSTETYVKNYHMESRPKLCIVLDQRRPMLFGTRTRLKITQALRVATLLAFAAEQHQIKVQYLLINNQVQWLGDANYEQFLEIANHAKLIDKIQKQASLEKALYQLSSNNQLKSGSMVYLISDFFDFTSDLDDKQKQPLAQLQEHCFVQALHIADPVEKQLVQHTKRPKRGEVCFKDMFSKAKVSLDQEALTNLQGTLDEHLDNIKQTIIKSAASYSEIMTYEDKIHQHIILPLGH